MKLNYPFSFPKNTNTTYILENYVFSNNRGLALFVLVVILTLLLIWEYLNRKYNLFVQKLFRNIKIHPFILKNKSWFMIIAVSLLCIGYLIYDLKDYYNLVSLTGLVAFIIICLLVSEHPSKVSWKTLSKYYSNLCEINLFILYISCWNFDSIHFGSFYFKT